MLFDVKMKYQEGYLPTKRHRKLRFNTIEEIVKAEIKEIDKDLTLVAFKVDENEYRVFEGNLYRKSDDIMYCSGDAKHLSGKVIEQFKYSFLNHSSFYGFEEHETKEHMLSNIEDYTKRFLIIDNEVWSLTGEPRYVIHVFGLGRNHGGTSLSVSNYYNENISRNAYFNANERDKAIERALEIAEGRGDTKYLDRIKNCPEIEVLISEMVCFNPKKEIL